MRGYFDEDEAEPERPRRDTELTLGAGAVLGLVAVLLLVCGLCFAAGYTMGHHASVPSAASNGPTPAPEQEPLQGNNSIPKPSASAQPAAPAPQPGDSPTSPDPGTPAAGENPTTTEQGPANGEPGGSSTGSPAAKAPGLSQPAQPAAGNTAPATQTPNVHPALPTTGKLMVQIAAVANPQDADVLATALRKRSYAVTAAREPGDGLIHVRIGPFASRDEASHWRDKLLGDGYNAVVQP